jgi:hypothetical protein
LRGRSVGALLRGRVCEHQRKLELQRKSSWRAGARFADSLKFAPEGLGRGEAERRIAFYQLTLPVALWPEVQC